MARLALIIPNPTHRYSDHASILAGPLFPLAMAVAVLLTLTILRKHRQDPNFPLYPAAFTALMTLLVFVFARLWSHNHPKLILTETHLGVHRFAAFPLRIPWQDMQHIDDVRRISLQLGFRRRRIEIHWQGGILAFGPTYFRFPDLIARLNQTSQTHHIALRLRDYNPVARSTPTSQPAEAAVGVIHPVPALDPAPQADTTWTLITGRPTPR